MKKTAAILVAALVAAPLAAHAADTDKFTFDTSGWLVLNSYSTFGTVNAADLPRWAVPAMPGDTEKAFGMGVRQSRVRMNFGIPTDGLIPKADMKGLVEADFMGGYAGNDTSLPLPRLRHAWVSATWKDYGKLTVLLGQSWGILEGPSFAASLSHLAIPRFGGAGFLYRRAPQLRVSQEFGGTFAVGYQVAVMAPMDRETSGVPGSSGVGERAGQPDGEGRIAAYYRPQGPFRAEVGVSTHLGQEKFLLTGDGGTAKLPTPVNEWVASRGYAVDVKFDVPYVQLVGGVFTGENLDVNYALGGVNKVTHKNAAGTVLLDDAVGVDTRGMWGQAIVTPVKGLQLLVGGGIENPGLDDTLPTLGATDLYVYRNGQVSAGAILNITSKWRISLEGTRYATGLTNAAYATSRADATQIEISTLLAL
jgi:hypothetical protein